MKKESNFVLYAFLAVVAIGVGLYALLVPKSYDWRTSPTDLNSEEPFAQKVMHDVLSHSFSHGYRVSDDLDSTLKQQEKNGSNENLIVFASADFYAAENNLEQLQRMAQLARNGRRIVYNTHITTVIDHSFFGLADNRIGGDWQLDLNDAQNVPKGKRTLLPFPLIYDNGQIDMSEKGGRETVFDCMIGIPFDSLNNENSSKMLAYGHRRTGAQSIFIPMSSLQFESTAQKRKNSIATYQPQAIRVVLSDEDGNVYGLRYEFASGGSITWIAGGAMFTNYGFSVSQWRGLARPILADLDNRPVCFVNATYKNKTGDAQEDDYNTPFSFFIERPPLRLALWIPIGMAILALLFNTRRALPASRAQFVAGLRPTAQHAVQKQAQLHFSRAKRAALAARPPAKRISIRAARLSGRLCAANRGERHPRPPSTRQSRRATRTTRRTARHRKPSALRDSLAVPKILALHAALARHSSIAT